MRVPRKLIKPGVDKFALACCDRLFKKLDNYEHCPKCLP